MWKTSILIIFFFILMIGSSTTNDAPTIDYLIKCDEKLQNHIRLMDNYNYDTDSHSRRKEFMDSCGPVLECFDTNEKIKYYHSTAFDLLVTVKSVCKLATIAETVPCFKEVQNSVSECLKSWKFKLPNETLQNESAREKACKNYFGKDACMEQEVTELCGEKLWLELRDLSMDLSIIVFKYCKPEEMVASLVKAAVSSSSICIFLFFVLVLHL